MTGFDSVTLGSAFPVRDSVGSRYPLDAHISAETGILATVRRMLTPAYAVA